MFKYNHGVWNELVSMGHLTHQYVFWYTWLKCNTVTKFFSHQKAYDLQLTWRQENVYHYKTHWTLIYCFVHKIWNCDVNSNQNVIRINTICNDLNFLITQCSANKIMNCITQILTVWACKCMLSWVSNDEIILYAFWNL